MPEITSHFEQSPDVLTAMAIISIHGALADGEASPLEFQTFMNSFRKHFIVSETLAAKIALRAMKYIQGGKSLDSIDEACAVLVTHLNKSQRLSVYYQVEDIVLVDKKVYEQEKHYLSYLFKRLHLALNDIQ